MSGGVDSSVAALLLRKQGYDVVGLFMRTGSHAEEFPQSGCAILEKDLNNIGTKSHKHGCCSAADASDARGVADKLDIPFYALDFEPEFTRIMDYFVDEYTHGRTPNPCVMCNNWLKFGRLWEYARQIEADYIATGHYARATNGCVLRACDRSKDQSYVLFGIDRQILHRLLFPIGEYQKVEIREIARELSLRVAEKPDSQEICFVPSNNYVDFIQGRRPNFDGSGEIVDTSGKVLARHDGFQGFTIGQRKGLGVALGERRYVIDIDSDRHRVVIGSREQLLRKSLVADRVNWLIDEPTESFSCRAQIRYLHQAASAILTPLGGGEVRVEFDKPQSAITPGQAVVLYAGDQLLGGGFIKSS